uniref:Uncharacterized protein n=1 Tax=Lutzomyia longipalpis TaxID=7200 RepID=A0A7G3B4H7_LUTLO
MLQIYTNKCPTPWSFFFFYFVILEKLWVGFVIFSCLFRFLRMGNPTSVSLRVCLFRNMNIKFWQSANFF